RNRPHLDKEIRAVVASSWVLHHRVLGKPDRTAPRGRGETSSPTKGQPVRTRAIVASVLVSIAALIGIGAGGRSDPPARAAKRAVRGPIIALSTIGVSDGIAAAGHEIETYLAWQLEQDLIAAYLDAIAHPPPPP